MTSLRTLRPPRRPTARLLLALPLVTAVLASGAALAPAEATAVNGSATTREWPGHPGRRVVAHRVAPGESASSIATRFHAWTAELLAINHKSRGSYFRAGERILVPIVSARARPHAKKAAKHPSKARVRAEVVRVAKANGVRPKLALAIAWQESGWQQHVRSSVGAIGTMQVMPGNAGWLSAMVGRKLHLTRLHDNVLAGVLLFKMLRKEHGVKVSIRGYYQGIGSLAHRGPYPSTKQYSKNVSRHWTRLRHGWDPLG